MHSEQDNKNFWTTEKDAVASWKITLPYPNAKNKIQALLRLYQQISELGEEYEVYSVKRKDNDFHLPATSSYSNEIELCFMETGILKSFGVGNNLFVDLDFVSYSKLGYYDLHGHMQEKYIKDIGSLLIDNQSHLQKNHLNYVRHIPPINIWEGDIYYSESHLDTLNIYIDLETDIWFPWVMGVSEDKNSNIKSSVNHPILGNAYDNRELARCHTPRLNRFLATTAKLILDFGGEWEKGDDATNYIEMFSSVEIILD
jgi:hypothetical protein